MEISSEDIWFVYPREEDASSTYNWIMETAIRLNMTARIIYHNQLVIMNTNQLIYNGERLKLPKVAFLRGYFEKLALFLNENSVITINNYAPMNTTQDKFMTNYMLRINNLPTPLTIINDNLSYQEAERLLDNSSMVVKANRGSKGEGVFLIHNENEYNHAVESIYEDIIIQEVITSSLGKDLRVYVLNKKVLGAVKRVSTTDDFRANISLGATAEFYECEQELIDLCLNVAELFKLDFCGIDVLFDKNGYSICEVNGNAAFRGISKVSKLDMIEELLRYALDLINKL